MSIQSQTGADPSRQKALAVLAHSSTQDLAALVASLAPPAHETIRAPEQGLVMVRGRVGGDGAPFNLGEATVSRAAIRLTTGEVGFGYVLGRDGEKASLIALCDAMFKAAQHRDDVEAKVLAPLRQQLTTRRDARAVEVAATRVDFYTMVRGEG
jgi:alpha-D-ribose 1-methylphosphonate 5-triphosphate synthase subunit PhnG